ncbi:MAG: CCA tRNA nucleotidyltransferase, partial [Pseudomonadota bacterium]
RIGAEFIKVMAAPDPSFAVAGMVQTGVMRHVLPGADVSAVPILVHMEDTAPDALRRLATLGDFDWAGQLRLSNKDQVHLNALRAAALSGADPAALGYLHGADLGWDAVLVRSALTQSPPNADAKADVKRGAAQTFPLIAADLMPEFQGPSLGAALKSAKSHWIDLQFAPTKSDLIAWLKAR